MFRQERKAVQFHVTENIMWTNQKLTLDDQSEACLFKNSVVDVMNSRNKHRCSAEASWGKPRASIWPIGHSLVQSSVGDVKKMRMKVDVSDTALEGTTLCTGWSDGNLWLIAGIKIVLRRRNSVFVSTCHAVDEKPWSEFHILLKVINEFVPIISTFPDWRRQYSELEICPHCL